MNGTHGHGIWNAIVLEIISRQMCGRALDSVRECLCRRAVSATQRRRSERNSWPSHQLAAPNYRVASIRDEPKPKMCVGFRPSVLFSHICAAAHEKQSSSFFALLHTHTTNVHRADRYTRTSVQHRAGLVPARAFDHHID